jgi:hypothetical protein
MDNQKAKNHKKTKRARSSSGSSVSSQKSSTKNKKRSLSSAVSSVLSSNSSTRKRQRIEPKKAKQPLHTYIQKIVNNNLVNPVKDEELNAIRWSAKPLIISTLLNYYFQKFRSKNYTFYIKLDLNNSKKTLKKELIQASNQLKQDTKNMFIKCIPIYFSFRGVVGKKNLQSFEESDLIFASHANLLLYRPSQFTIEWFEPHGNIYSGQIVTPKILKQFIQFFTNHLQTSNRKIQIIYPNIVCPYINGLQGLEGQSTLKKISNGYCALWSLLIMKLALKYNYKSLSEIVSEILALYKTPDELRKLMYSFSKEVNSILQEYYNIHLGQDEMQQKQNIMVPANIPESSQYSYSQENENKIVEL